ncbi:DUF6482 family protein [Pseudomonas syringae pv. actinidiae]|uniref:Cation transporter n=2 Tax=Pseudomonas syringae group TaxID=136849 RepID=A0A0K8LU67_PSESF|nr:DUF6482 family protein [Pseudomonas syringae]EPN55558.1 hypothetical protein A235_37146 [Pseudomonas syringae pv. actinidiae ICMP 19079]EPN86493.1 hypothetical protein A234_01375 [Pseudomonas syringae pv. actinidiae ICMP 19101]OZI87212.1 cation transporter [Pseudomonas avellanae]AKT28691.1 cation transporter [Pseudomonas syringae pv. actinidiae ICMP 18884]AOE55220.1 cation transporter [Pseudomonas syringae pv. actinidiae ICMP 18708]
MNYQDFTDHAQAGRVEELNLISIEGGIYLLDVRMNGTSVMLKDAVGNTLHLRSVEHARELLKNVPVVPFYLVHCVVHDELCGMPVNDRSEMRMPICFHSSWS